MNLEDEKSKFIKNEIFASSIAGAFRQGKGYPIYLNGKEITDKQRADLYNFIKSKLDKYEVSYKNKVSEEEHIKNIESLREEINKNYSKILKLHFGRTQKLLNLYLKYLWVLNLIEEPPHCPFDRIIIEKLKANTPAWTSPVFNKEHYVSLVNLANKESSKDKLSIASWELWFWNDTVLKIKLNA